MLLLTDGTRSFPGIQITQPQRRWSFSQNGGRKKMLVKATNKVGTEVYYLGNFSMQSLQQDKVPNVDSRPDLYQESITIRSDNGFRVRNKRQDIARTSSNKKRQDSSTSKKSSVTPSAKKKARTGPKPSLSSSDEELPKRLTEQSSKSLTEQSSKNKDGALINGKSNSDDESDSSDESSSSDDKSETSNNSPSNEE
jgi:hypothetical protein